MPAEPARQDDRDDLGDIGDLDQRLDLLARLPGDVLCVVDEGGRTTYVSASVERTFGYTPERFMAIASSVELIHPDDVAALGTLWVDVHAARDVEVRGEFRLKIPDGSWRWAEVIAINRIDDPAIAGVALNFRDITERREAERALRENEELLRTITNGMTDVLVLVDGIGLVRWCSPSVHQVLGYEPETVVGASLLDFAHPTDVAGALPALTRMIAGQDVVTPFIMRARHASGEWRYIEAFSRHLAADASQDGSVLSLRDVTKRVVAERALAASEARFRAFVESSKDLTGVIDDHGRITWLPPSVTDMLGFLPEELIGTQAFDLIHPDDAEQAIARFGHVTEVGAGKVDPLTLRVKCKDGSWLTVEGIGSLLTDADGVVDSILINVRDVTWRLHAEEAVRRSEARFRAVVSGSFDVTALVDRMGTVQWITPNAEHLLGWNAEDVVGRNGLDFIHPDDIEFVTAELISFAEGRGVPSPTPIRMLHRDGNWRDVEIVGSNFLDHPDINGIAVNLRDVAERLTAERERQRLTDIFSLTSDLVAVTTVEGELVYLNDSGRRFFGLEPDTDLTTFDLAGHIASASLARMVAEVMPAIDQGGSWGGEVELIRADGTMVPMLGQLLAHRDATGSIECFSGVLRDIGERKSFERQLEHEATHDPLTGLPNRTLLLDRLEIALARARRRNTAVAVLFCDLDHFKVVNDSMGHSYGDLVLREVARRLETELRPGDTVARFGGDEFVILCEDIESPNDAVIIAKRADHAMSTAFALDGHDVYVGVSVGIAIASGSTRHIADPETLIRDADAAMYRAKARGRGRYQVFEPGIGAQAVDRFDLENALRRALQQRELDVHYQPVIEIASGSLVGVEALVRWDHPQRGQLLPGEFISLAEETGIVLPLGEWVLEEACRQMRVWDELHNGRSPGTLAVNLSARKLGHPELIGQVERALAASLLAPERLHLEVTESVLMDDVESSEAILRSLKELGINVAVDDFGTGYSSLSYLRRFPVDSLKVDRSFVDGLGSEPEDTAIVAAIVNLAHTLGLHSVGEGVETAEQFEQLRELGCDMAQGYFLARPMPAAELTKILLATPDP